MPFLKSLQSVGEVLVTLSRVVLLNIYQMDFFLRTTTTTTTTSTTTE